MHASGSLRASTSRIGRFWNESTRRRRILIGLAGLAFIVATWNVYERIFVWPSRLSLRSADGNYPLAFSPDGSKLVTSAARGFHLWDTKTGKKLGDWFNSEGRRGTSGKFSSDGRTFESFWAIQGQLGTPMVGLIDVTTGRLDTAIPRPLTNIWGSAFLEEGRTLRLFSRNNTARSIVDVDTATANSGLPLKLSAPALNTWQVMSDDGRILAIIESRNLQVPVGTRSVILWDINDDRQFGVISTSVPVGSINALCLSRDGKTLVMSLSDRTIEAWDIPSGKLLSRFTIHSPDFRPWMLRLSADGSKVASTGQWASPALSVNTARFMLQRLVQNPNPMIFELVVHDVITGRRLGRADNEGLATAISDDGRSLATSNEDGATRIRDLPPSP